MSSNGEEKEMRFRSPSWLGIGGEQQVARGVVVAWWRAATLAWPRRRPVVSSTGAGEEKCQAWPDLGKLLGI